MLKKKKKQDSSDDGRVIAPMNVEGMPWHISRMDQHAASSGEYQPEKLTPKENLAFAFGVLRAVLLVAGVFIGGLLLFILFCTNVWFK